MNRRELFQRAAAVAAAPLAATAQTAAPVSAWKPAFLDDHQNATVVALSELIIPATDTPGAKLAHVNRYLDLFLRDGDANLRSMFMTGLNWLDGHALAQHNHPFVACTHDQQVAILTALDEGHDPALAPGTQFFRLAKRLTSGIYYATEIGTKELNKGGAVPAGFGCSHSQHG